MSKVWFVTGANSGIGLGIVLVRLAAMENPVKIFAAGSDALAMITPVVEDRLRELKDNAELSKSSDGSY